MRWLATTLLAVSFALPCAALAADEAPKTELPRLPDDAPPSVASAPPPVRRVVLRGIKFGSDTAYIEPASAGVLELVAQQLRDNPTIRVRIEGYTDERASEQHNLELSVERAESVKRILVGFGVGPERLEVVGFGESHPIATNGTPEGRALNRRVELDVIE